MELSVQRIWTAVGAGIGGSDGASTGVLSADGRQICFTLEDPVREVPGESIALWKIPGQTAIPRGRYRVAMTFSERFGHSTPQLLNVPGFTGIRIHKGDTAADTAGCILVGEKRISDDYVADCEPAYEAVVNLIENAIANAEQVWITVG